MNKNCEIIKDLLPLYVDRLTSEESNKLIEEHINACDKCKEMLENMKMEETSNSDEIKTIDYLKKVKVSLTKECI